MILRHNSSLNITPPSSKLSFKGLQMKPLIENSLIKLNTNGGPVAATIASSLAIGTMRPLLLIKDKELKPEDKIYSAFWYAAVSGIALGLLLLYKKPLEDGLFKLSANLLKNKNIQKSYNELDTAKKGLKNVTDKSLSAFSQAQSNFNEEAKLGNGNAVKGLQQIMIFVSNMTIMTTMATVVTKYLKPFINTVLPKKTDIKLNNKKDTSDNKIIKGPKDVAIMSAFGSAVGLLALSKFPVINGKMVQIFKGITSKINSNKTIQPTKDIGKANKVLENFGNFFKNMDNKVWTSLEVGVNGLSRFAILSSAKQFFSAISTGAGEGLNFALIAITSPITKLIQNKSLQGNTIQKKLIDATRNNDTKLIAEIKKEISINSASMKQFYVGEGQKVAIDMLITNFLTLGILSGIANNMLTKKLVAYLNKKKEEKVVAPVKKPENTVAAPIKKV